MPVCAVVGCNSCSDKENSCRSFPLPSGKKTRQEWLDRINRENYVPNKNTRVCIKHFAPEAFVDEADNVDSRGRKLNKVHLKPLAYPTLLMKPLGQVRKRRQLESWELDHIYAKYSKFEDEKVETIQEAANVLKPVCNDHSYGEKSSNFSSSDSENVVAEVDINDTNTNENDDATLVVDSHQFEVDTMDVIEQVNNFEGIYFFIQSKIYHCV